MPEDYLGLPVRNHCQVYDSRQVYGWCVVIQGFSYRLKMNVVGETHVTSEINNGRFLKQLSEIKGKIAIKR